MKFGAVKPGMAKITCDLMQFRAGLCMAWQEAQTRAVIAIRSWPDHITMRI